MEEKFKQWLAENSVDHVTRIVFNGLVRKCDNGDNGQLFRKLISLEQTECYGLASKLFSLIQFLGIGEEYKSFRHEFYETISQ